MPGDGLTLVARRGELPTGRLARAIPLAGLAGKGVLDATVGLARKLSPIRQSTADERLEHMADRYAAVLGDMKGAVMKAGQILSFIDAEGLVPGPYQNAFQGALSRLQDDVPPMAPDTAAAVFTEELGMRPERVFSYFSPRPIAAASIGQVHVAHLADGTELAVKIQYPGAAEAVAADLANTEMLTTFARLGLSLMGGHAPSVDPKAVVEEVRDRITEELDYRLEKANQDEFAELYSGHPFIHVPAVRGDLSSRRVLTMDYVDGRRWAAAVESEETLRMRWGEAIYRFVFASLFRHGLFNADPHPGNYLFHGDGTVSFVDFGCVKRFSPSQLQLMSRLDDAAIAEDGLSLKEEFEAIGMLVAGDAAKVDPDRLLTYYRLQLRALWDVQPFAFTPEYAAEVVASTYDVLGEWGDIGRRITMPKDLVFLNRVVVGLLSILARLGATADWRAIDAEIRHGALPASAMGRAEAAWRQRRWGGGSDGRDLGYQ